MLIIDCCVCAVLTQFESEIPGLACEPGASFDSAKVALGPVIHHSTYPRARASLIFMILQAFIPCDSVGPWTPEKLVVEAQKHAEAMLDEYKCFAECSSDSGDDICYNVDAGADDY